MALEAIKQASNYAASTQVNANTAPATPAVNGVTPKQATNAQNDFSLENSAVAYGNETSGNKTSEDGAAGSTESIKAAVENLNKKMSNSVAQYGIHEATNRVTIKIVDKNTHKVIKEFPPEETLDMIAKAWELAGLLVDEKR